MITAKEAFDRASSIDIDDVRRTIYESILKDSNLGHYKSTVKVPHRYLWTEGSKSFCQDKCSEEFEAILTELRNNGYCTVTYADGSGRLTVIW